MRDRKEALRLEFRNLEDLSMCRLSPSSQERQSCVIGQAVQWRKGAIRGVHCMNNFDRGGRHPFCHCIDIHGWELLPPFLIALYQ
jgi:hypothetical protein